MKNLFSKESLAIADLHLGDVLAAKSMGYKDTKTHSKAVIASINEQLSNYTNPTLYLLGDIICDETFVSELYYIKCDDIQFITGNRECRDPEIIRSIYNLGYIPYSSLRVGNVILTHIPPHSTDGYRYDAIIHGHLHREHIMRSSYRNVSWPIRKGKLFNIHDFVESLRLAGDE